LQSSLVPRVAAPLAEARLKPAKTPLKLASEFTCLKLGRQETAGRPGRSQSSEFLAVAHSLGILLTLDQVAERDPDRDLVHARPVDIATDREEAKAFVPVGTLRLPTLVKPGVAEALGSVPSSSVLQYDRRDPSQCLDVV